MLFKFKMVTILTTYLNHYCTLLLFLSKIIKKMYDFMSNNQVLKMLCVYSKMYKKFK